MVRTWRGIKNCSRHGVVTWKLQKRSPRQPRQHGFRFIPGANTQRRDTYHGAKHSETWYISCIRVHEYDIMPRFTWYHIHEQVYMNVSCLHRCKSCIHDQNFHKWTWFQAGTHELLFHVNKTMDHVLKIIMYTWWSCQAKEYFSGDWQVRLHRGMSNFSIIAIFRMTWPCQRSCPFWIPRPERLSAHGGAGGWW